MRKLILMTCLIAISANSYSQILGKFREKRTEYILKNYDAIKEKQFVTDLSPNIKVIKDIPYSNNSKDNQLDIYKADTKATNKPVIIMVHGGAWLAGDKNSQSVIKNKAEYFVLQKDYIFVSINYRMERNNIHPQEVSDVAKAIDWVYKNISVYGGNPNKLILMGHSAGGHLVSLVATDNKYLNSLNSSTSIIKGVICLDAGAYDLPYLLRSEQIKNDIGRTIIGQKALEQVRSIDETAWGNYDEAMLADASPINHVNRNNPPFLIISSSNNKSHELVANKFENALRTEKVFVNRKDFNLKHEEINDFVGIPNHELTNTIQNFINQIN